MEVDIWYNLKRDADVEDIYFYAAIWKYAWFAIELKNGSSPRKVVRLWNTQCEKHLKDGSFCTMKNG